MSDSSNWGRWGPEDQQGALNLMTPELIRRAAGLVKTGKTYSLAVPLEAQGAQWPMRPKIWKVVEHGTVQIGEVLHGSSGDALMMHSHSGTHIDALCHIWNDNQLYNGFDAIQHVKSRGITRNAIDNVPFIVGRGVLLDVAGWKGVDNLALGEAVTADDLDGCAAAQNLSIEAGDILLLRTGWMRLINEDRALFDSGEPGIDMSTIPWLKAHDVVGIGADNHAVEVLPQIPPGDIVIHRAAIRDLGIYLMENFNLEVLAADKVYECLLVIAPLPIVGGAGSPINPIAIS